MTLMRFGIIMLALMLSVAVFASEPGYGPPLTATTGTVYRVGTATALINAVDAMNAASVPATILVSNGTYVINTWALPVTCDNVIIRSLSGDRDAVVIRGPDEGESASLEHVFWVVANNVTIADMTFGWCLYHGIQAHGQEPYNVSGLKVHNCRIVNCNEQFIKGTSETSDPEGVTDSLVEYCLFEFTNQWAYQYYTGGIDAHKAANWTVRDNLFRNIRATDGYAEHAIHFWNRNTSGAQNITVERNVIINCDRGIGFGLSDFTGGFDGGTSTIRNNFVYNNGDGPNTDVGIGLEYANNVSVDNNTVYVPYWAPIEYRFAGCSNLVFRNNLLNDPITARDGAPVPFETNNIETAQANWFRNLTNGDLHLLPGATAAIDHGATAAGFSDDINGESRPAGAAWDVGADEYDPWHADSDGDTMLDYWETGYGLNPTNATDASGNADSDFYINLHEWIADTDPTDSNEYFQILGISSGATAVITCRGASNRLYTLQYRTGLISGTWQNLAGQIRIAPTNNLTVLTDTNALSGPFYRIAVEVAP